MMTREQFIRAMGGQEKIDASGMVVVPCDCGHECCQGWNTYPAPPETFVEERPTQG